MPRVHTSRFVQLFVAVFVLSPFLALADSTPCTEAADQKRYSEAFEICLAFAEQGDVYAMRNLGHLHLNVRNDLLESYAWYHRAGSNDVLDAIRRANNQNLETLAVTGQALAAQIYDLSYMATVVARELSKLQGDIDGVRKEAEGTMNTGLQIIERVIQDIGRDDLSLNAAQPSTN